MSASVDLELTPTAGTPAGARTRAAVPALDAVPWTRLGAAVYGAGVAALGLQSLLVGDHVAGLAPVPAGAPARQALAYVTGVLLLAGGAGMLATRRARAAAAAVGTVFALWLVGLQLPALATHLGNGSIWTVAFEVVALGGAAWALAAVGGAWGPAWDRAALGGRVAVGVALCVFGGLHLVYHDVVASLVPRWIPGPMFWAYATGAAHLAAGLALVTGVLRRAGGVLVGVMFGLWVLIVHAPRVAAAPGNRQEWTSMLIALAMCGASWAVAGAGDARGGARR